VGFHKGTDAPDLLDVDQALALQPIACRRRWPAGSDAPCRLRWLARHIACCWPSLARDVALLTASQAGPPGESIAWTLTCPDSAQHLSAIVTSRRRITAWRRHDLEDGWSTRTASEGCARCAVSFLICGRAGLWSRVLNTVGRATGTRGCWSAAGRAREAGIPSRRRTRLVIDRGQESRHPTVVSCQEPAC
jgi:hypothetical protein